MVAQNRILSIVRAVLISSKSISLTCHSLYYLRLGQFIPFRFKLNVCKSQSGSEDLFLFGGVAVRACFFSLHLSLSSILTIYCIAPIPTSEARTYDSAVNGPAAAQYDVVGSFGTHEYDNPSLCYAYIVCGKPRFAHQNKLKICFSVRFAGPLASTHRSGKAQAFV